MEFELGQTYDGYEVLELLRNSQDAVEYRVQNTVAQRQELLKVLPTLVRDDQDAAGSFLREARILARLTHPHIIGFYTAQPIDGRLAMTTEWSGFAPLTARLAAGPLPWREALDAAAQLLSALSCLHDQNVVHLDITPDHILYSPDGAWKLANFAKARVINGVPLHGSGSVSGSPRYISPEQVKGGTLDYRSDLYSCAAVLFEMLCGRPPFDSKSQFELMLAHVSGIPEPPSRYNPALPLALDDVVLKALAKDPSERHASAADFASDLAMRTIGLNGRPCHAHLPEPASDVATQPCASDASAQPPVSDVPAQPSASDASAQARTPDASAQPPVSDTSAEPRPSDASAQPSVPDAPVQPRVSDASAQAPASDAAAQAPASDASAQAHASDASAQPCVPDPSHDRKGVCADLVEPLLFGVVDEPIAPAALAAVAEPIAATTPQDAEPVLAVAVDEPIAPAAPAGVAEPIAATTPQAAEPLLTVAVDEPIAPAAPAAVAASTPQDAEPLLTVAVDEPAAPAALAPIVATPQAAEPVLAVAVDGPAAPPALAVVADSAPVPAPDATVTDPAPASMEPVEAPQLDAALALLASQAPVEPPVAPLAPGPDPSIQANLWAAAAIVAQAAAVAPAPVPEPVTIVAVPQPLPADPTPTVAPAPPVEAPPQYPIPALMAASRDAADTTHWIMFGSSAAFLAIVLLAIFLGMK